MSSSPPPPHIPTSGSFNPNEAIGPLNWLPPSWVAPHLQGHDFKIFSDRYRVNVTIDLIRSNLPGSQQGQRKGQFTELEAEEVFKMYVRQGYNEALLLYSKGNTFKNSRSMRKAYWQRGRAMQATIDHLKADGKELVDPNPPSVRASRPQRTAQRLPASTAEKDPVVALQVLENARRDLLLSAMRVLDRETLEDIFIESYEDPAVKSTFDLLLANATATVSSPGVTARRPLLTGRVVDSTPYSFGAINGDRSNRREVDNTQADTAQKVTQEHANSQSVARTRKGRSRPVPEDDGYVIELTMNGGYERFPTRRTKLD